MKLDVLLCDAASVRENLLNVLGAGITSFAASGFPTQVPASLGFLVWIETDEDEGPHLIQIEITQGSDRRASVDVGFEIEREKSGQPEGPAPIAVDLRPLVIPEAGMITIGIKLDEHPVRSLELLATPAPPEATQR